MAVAYTDDDSGCGDECVCGRIVKLRLSNCICTF